jgi:hypothetical protein
MKQNKGGRNKVAENNKRVSALNRLETQLKSGVKSRLVHVEGSGCSTWQDISLTEGDIKRINKEISVLKSRIVSNEVALSIRTKKYRGGAIR